MCSSDLVVEEIENPGIQPCGAELPVFFGDTGGLYDGGVDGTPGPGDGSTEVEPGQLVARWQTDFDITIEVRWPGTPVPTDTTTMEVPSSSFVMNLWPANFGSGSKRIFVTVRLDDDSTGPCSLLSVEAYAPRVDPILDFLFGFAAGLRPRSERAEFVAAQVNASARARPRRFAERPLRHSPRGDARRRR